MSHANQVDKLLIIGWRAAEQPFLQLLAENLTNNIKVLVTAGGRKEGGDTIERLRQAGIKGEFNRTDGGFTDLVVERRADQFLEH